LAGREGEQNGAGAGVEAVKEGAEKLGGFAEGGVAAWRRAGRGVMAVVTLVATSHRSSGMPSWPTWLAKVLAWSASVTVAVAWPVRASRMAWEPGRAGVFQCRDDDVLVVAGCGDGGGGVEPHDLQVAAGDGLGNGVGELGSGAQGGSVWSPE
jgi:hypothetical protein